MSRTRRLKLAYATLSVLVVGGVAALGLTVGAWPALIAFVLLMLLPGRVQGYFYRDFFRGRRLFAQGRFADAIPHFERFLADVRARPWLKRLLWLQLGIYTTDVEVMTLNNLGGAHVQLGELDAGERYLEEALRMDPRYAMAFYNLSMIAALRGDTAGAERLAGEAERLGFTGGGVDRILAWAGERLVQVEGHGAG
jgi:tetratricopeptide (TPR) repeat protein